MQNVEDPKNLRRFVKQPDKVSKGIWFLRKLEWEWVSRIIGLPQAPYGKVLDIASEVRVSSRLFQKNWSIWRVDFSFESARLARQYGPKYKGHVVIKSSQPKIPFCRKSFEAAVSVGPFDFKFLNKKILLSEVKDSLKVGGKFVFSLATDKSPYCTPFSRKKYHYWSLEEISGVVREWKVGKAKRVNIPQPSFIYSRIVNNRYVPTLVFDALITYPLLWLCPYVPNRLGKYVILSLDKRFDC